jgi:hypothetical protein
MVVGAVSMAEGVITNGTTDPTSIPVKGLKNSEYRREKNVFLAETEGLRIEIFDKNRSLADELNRKIPM